MSEPIDDRTAKDDLTEYTMSLEKRIEGAMYELGQVLQPHATKEPYIAIERAFFLLNGSTFGKPRKT